MEENFKSCLDKQRQIKNLFNAHTSPEQRYELIISLGKRLPLIEEAHRVEENIVRGCQSIVYLHSALQEEKLYFTAYSEAVISSGLAALLIKVYSGESPEVILKCKPTFLDELNIYASLTPGRSNGLASMLLRMQHDALKSLVTL